MLPGPTLFYECPTCNVLLCSPSLITANHYGEIKYSDGKTKAFMAPDFPIHTKCSRCSTFVWINKMDRINKKADEFTKDELTDARWVEFLTIYEYLSMLEHKFLDVDDIRETIIIRIRILWGFNDRVRENKPIFNSKLDEDIWHNNICTLLFFLEESFEPDDLILKAELYRNLGNFKLCKYCLEFLDKPEYDNLINAFLNECDKKNTFVFQLN